MALIGFCALTAVVTVIAPPRRAKAAIDGQPNIIFIMSDDHAAHATSCYGSEISRTPNIDRLAEEGMRFTLDRGFLDPISRASDSHRFHARDGYRG